MKSFRSSIQLYTSLCHVTKVSVHTLLQQRTHSLSNARSVSSILTRGGCLERDMLTHAETEPHVKKHNLIFLPTFSIWFLENKLKVRKRERKRWTPHRDKSWIKTAVLKWTTWIHPTTHNEHVPTTKWPTQKHETNWETSSYFCTQHRTTPFDTRRRNNLRL